MFDADNVGKNYDPDGYEYDSVMAIDGRSGRTTFKRVIQPGYEFDGWIVYKHPDGQWVSLREATAEDDRIICDYAGVDSIDELAKQLAELKASASHAAEARRVEVRLREVANGEPSAKYNPHFWMLIAQDLAASLSTQPRYANLRVEEIIERAKENVKDLPRVQRDGMRVVVTRPGSVELYQDDERLPIERMGVTGISIKLEPASWPRIVIELAPRRVEFETPESIVRTIVVGDDVTTEDVNEPATQELPDVVSRASILGGSYAQVTIDIRELARDYMSLPTQTRWSILRFLKLADNDEINAAIETTGEEPEASVQLDRAALSRAFADGRVQELRDAVSAAHRGATSAAQSTTSPERTMTAPNTNDGSDTSSGNDITSDPNTTSVGGSGSTSDPSTTSASDVDTPSQPDTATQHLSNE